ncbi:MAG: indole-3-glycerol phosphate synthase TrpC [Gammaproteobacteria bacterium]
MNDLLKKIIAHKKTEVARCKEKLSLPNLVKMISTLELSRPFVESLEKKVKIKQPAVIAEIKKASPSKGIIREDFDPIAIAKNYEQAGATCLSILTDAEFFQGHPQYLAEIRNVTTLPLLRKDFIIDPYQIYETKVLGGDCILLLVNVLSDFELKEFIKLADELKLDCLLEVHTYDELERALQLNTRLIGINNRNLKSFETKLETTLSLVKYIPKDKLIVTESGLKTREDILLMEENNIYAFLIGETLMKEKNPGNKLRELFYP